MRVVEWMRQCVGADSTPRRRPAGADLGLSRARENISFRDETGRSATAVVSFRARLASARSQQAAGSSGSDGGRRWIPRVHPEPILVERSSRTTGVPFAKLIGNVAVFGIDTVVFADAQFVSPT